MFSGIVDHFGEIISLEKFPTATRAVIRCQFNDIVEGESIAVDGICLTAIDPQKQQFSCDISPETLSLTTAQNFCLGSAVNLERALRYGDRIGGHLVTGHVDQRGKLLNKQQHGEFIALDIGNVKPDFMPHLLKKGSIAINGVSLTINELLPHGFQVMLIPHTLERTSLKNLSVGDSVNLEYDWLIKVIINQQLSLKSVS